jgi:hypothetical protein
MPSTNSSPHLPRTHGNTEANNKVGLTPVRDFKPLKPGSKAFEALPEQMPTYSRRVRSAATVESAAERKALCERDMKST